MPQPNRFSTWFGGRFAPWDLDDPAPPYIDLRYFADVMREFEALVPQGGWHILATDDLAGPLPVDGRDVVVLCLGDELAVTPRYAHRVALVAKTMGGRSRRPTFAPRPSMSLAWLPLLAAQELLVQLRRTPWAARALAQTLRLRRRAQILDIPLGIRAYVDVPPKPIGERSYDVAFAGSLVNEEREHRRPWASQKLRARQVFLAEVERLRERRPDLAIWLRVVATHWDGATATGSYAHALADAKAVLCPRGSSVDTHRYFETLRAGAVPIYEMLPRRAYYDGAPGIRIRDWNELEGILDRLRHDPAELERLHRDALAWYERWVAPPAVAAQIARRLRG